MTNDNSERALVAYVPVLHRGYLDLFYENREADMHVLDQDVLDEFDYLRKDIRALGPQESRRAIKALDIFPEVKLLGKAALSGMTEQYDEIIMPNDDLSRQLSEQYFKASNVEFESVFLRWDRENSVVNQEIVPDRTIEANDYENEVVRLLHNEAQQATSWWRRVGAAIIVDGEIKFSAHNTNRPTEYSSYIDGDPRSTLKRGVGIEITNDQHAEPILIGWCAQNEGLSSKGATIWVDTFPCPKCAKDIVSAGIAQVYYLEGYAVTDAQDVLRAGGVEMVKVITDKDRPDKGKEWVPYPEKK